MKDKLKDHLDKLVEDILHLPEAKTKEFKEFLLREAVSILIDKVEKLQKQVKEIQEQLNTKSKEYRN